MFSHKEGKVKLNKKNNRTEIYPILIFIHSWKISKEEERDRAKSKGLRLGQHIGPKIRNQERGPDRQ